MTISSISNIDELRDIIAQAVGDETPFSVYAGGTKAQYGNPTLIENQLDISAMQGVIDYEPEELIITMHAATPLHEVEQVLAERGQMLSFEPPHISHLYGTKSEGTIGGVIATNLSGPRRLSAGAARDYLLGFEAVSGRASKFRSGSKVVKNVTGYDLSKLMCGSFGTLAIMDEMTLKVLPAPETSLSLIVGCASLELAAAAARAAMQTAYEPSATAILPQSAHKISAQAAIAVIRLEGVGVSVEDRAGHLQKILSEFGHPDRLEAQSSKALWADIADCKILDMNAPQIWRISTAPTAGPLLLQGLQDQLDCEGYMDWAGGLLWLSCADEGAHKLIRGHLAKLGGGHATLMRADEALRQAISVFEPQPKALSALNERIQQAFDPKYILNPGRL